MDRALPFVLLLVAALAACAGTHARNLDAATNDVATNDVATNDVATNDVASVLDGAVDASSSDAPAARDAADSAIPRSRCSQHSDCVISPRSCCGRCGEADQTDVIALHQADAPAYRSRVECASVFCPSCAGVRDPHLLPECRAGFCEVVDLRTDPANSCSSSRDCSFNVTDTCCPCGDVSEERRVATSSGGARRVAELICADPGACPPCVPVYPVTDAVPFCRVDPDGRGQCVIASGP